MYTPNIPNPNGRIDIIVFPSGGKEIIGRISSDPEVSLDTLIEKANEFISTLSESDKPRKFTSHYNSTQLENMIWEPYNENNPIILVDKKDLGIPYSSESSNESISTSMPIVETIPIEASTLSIDVIEKYTE